MTAPSGGIVMGSSAPSHSMDVSVSSSPSASSSFVSRLPVTPSVEAASSSAVCVSSVATGASLTPVTITLVVAVAVPPLPSLIVYVNEVVRVSPSAKSSKSPFGSKVTSPFAVTENRPPLDPAAFVCGVTVRSSLASGSESFIRTLPTAVASSSSLTPLSVSSTATGTSFVGVIVIVTVAVSVAP